MNSEFKQEIRFGIENSDKVFAAMMAIAIQDFPQQVKSPALAFECLGYYNALEHLMLRFLKKAGHAKPSGAASHRDTMRLFQQFLNERGTVMQESESAFLLELMGFRHVATKIYSFIIDYDRLLALVARIQTSHVAIRSLFESLIEDED